MSISPGVTYRPATSTTLNAFAGSIVGATAAILPPWMATSRIALILFLGSMTWPPRSSKSYGCWASRGPTSIRQSKSLRSSWFPLGKVESVAVCGYPAILRRCAGPCRASARPRIRKIHGPAGLARGSAMECAYRL